MSKRAWTRGVRGARAVMLMLAALGCVGCVDTEDDAPLTPEEIWGETGAEGGVEEPIDYRPRAAVCAPGVVEEGCYGLPREGMSSVADLIAALPPLKYNDFGSPDPGQSNVFVAPGVEFSTNRCPGEGPIEVEQLPMVIEAVVTLHPRRYLKVAVCGQDERNYGTFTIEDDTGGIVVLRNSRVAPFTFGDRVRLTISGVTRVRASDDSTRAVLIADVEVLAPVKVGDGDGGERFIEPVYYDAAMDDVVPGFGPEDTTQVKRIEGHVHVAPTNDNFNALVVTDRRVSPEASQTLTGGTERCSRLCQPICAVGCGTDTRTDRDTGVITYGSEEVGDACRDACAEVCEVIEEPEPDPDDSLLEAALAEALPACWLSSIDPDLGRRGLTVPSGALVRVTGPVVNSFGFQIWVMSLGQVERLDE